MSAWIRRVLTVLAVGVVAIVGALGWYRLAMSYGLPGSPGWLAAAIGADGEGAYDAMAAEMVIILVVVLFGILAILKRVRRQRGGG
jgi:hypothetical protein